MPFSPISIPNRAGQCNADPAIDNGADLESSVRRKPSRSRPRHEEFPIEPEIRDDKRESCMSSQVMSPNTEAAILARLIQARDSRSREVAEYLLSIDFDAGDLERMNRLGERAREGNLTAEETAELDSYLHVGSLLSILQSKARRLLKSESPAQPRQ
jgi:hypothetical protein